MNRTSDRCPECKEDVVLTDIDNCEDQHWTGHAPGCGLITREKALSLWDDIWRLS